MRILRLLCHVEQGKVLGRNATLGRLIRHFEPTEGAALGLGLLWLFFFPSFYITP